MAKATKSVSSFALFFILFLVIFEMPEIEAQDDGDDDECLKEYGGDVGFAFCAPRIFPPFCYSRCRADKDAKGGKCVWNDSGVKCLCDYCSDDPYDQLLRGGV